MSDQKTLMREMLANAVHFGHKGSKWNPKMAPFIYTKKNGVHVFDLNQTYKGLVKAKEFLTAAVAEGKTVLFVSTKQQATELVEAEAEKCGMPYVTQKWIPGMLTNFSTIRNRVRHLKKLKEEKESGEFEKFTKKEALQKEKEINKLQIALGGVENLEKTPDIVFILDLCRDKIAVKEANKIGATIVGIADSNANPEGVQHLIPGNDDALKAIKFFITQISEAVQAGKAKKK